MVICIKEKLCLLLFISFSFSETRHAKCESQGTETDPQMISDKGTQARRLADREVLFTD